MNTEQSAALREPFPPAVIGKLPKLSCKSCSAANNRVCADHTKTKCNVCRNYISTAHIDLDYVGHAEVTDRLLTVDPEWTWEPVAVVPETGEPLLSNNGCGLWIRMTVAGVTRLGYGDVERNKAWNVKELISDALRNAAMRFGVALDLWSKGELESAQAGANAPDEEPELASPSAVAALRKRIAALPEGPRKALSGEWKAAFPPLARLRADDLWDATTLVESYETAMAEQSSTLEDSQVGPPAGPPTTDPAGPPEADPGRPFEAATA